MLSLDETFIQSISLMTLRIEKNNNLTPKYRGEETVTSGGTETFQTMAVSSILNESGSASGDRMRISEGLSKGRCSKSSEFLRSSDKLRGRRGFLIGRLRTGSPFLPSCWLPPPPSSTKEENFSEPSLMERRSRLGEPPADVRN